MNNEKLSLFLSLQFVEYAWRVFECKVCFVYTHHPRGCSCQHQLIVTTVLLFLLFFFFINNGIQNNDQEYQTGLNFGKWDFVNFFRREKTK